MSWFTRLKNALNPRQLDNELAEEMRDHIDRRAADLRQQGLSAYEAERQARVAFGNISSTSERSRELRLWSALESTWQDVRYAWRGMLRNPLFALAAIVSLGLAIGANTAIYSIVDAVLLRSLPVPRPDRLFTLAATASDGPDDLVSYPLFGELREAAGDSARIALFDTPNRMEAEPNGPNGPREEVMQQFVSPDAFDVLGVPPAAGRLFSREEEGPPTPRPVVVLSYEYWRRRFGADPAVVGRSFTVSGRTYSILGVVREGFFGAEPGKFIDIWLPIALADPGIFSNAEFRPFRLLGRLAPETSREQVAARLQPAFQRHQNARARGTAMPDAMKKQLSDARIVALRGDGGISGFRRTFSRPLWILLGVAACTLLVACANVASLLLARSTARAGEMALRVSLGARRSRLVRQLLTESLVISVLAGLCGWVLARIAAPILVASISTKAAPVSLDLALDTRVLLFCAAICAVSALFFGLLPAWQATDTRPMFALRRASGHAGRLRLGRLFVGVQVAFAFCLVTGGTGFLFSLRNLTSVDTGFDLRGVTVLTVTNVRQRDRQLPVMQQMQTRVSALPNVQATAAAWLPLFSGSRRVDRVLLPGKPPSDREETFYRVSPSYFATLRTPLLSGRDFIAADNDDEPVPTIVNVAFAWRYFGAESVIGKTFRRDDGVRHQIVGLAANSHYGDLHSGPEPIAYMPMKPPMTFTLYVRSTLDAASVARMVEREAAELGTRVRDVTTLEALVGSTILKEKLLAGIGGAFGVLGLTLAAVGLFGLLNYSVTRRTKEIGIRVALGAPRMPLYGLLLQDLVGLMAGGLIIGTAASLTLMRFSQSLLFGVQPADFRVMGTAAAIFIAAALVAGGMPAYRAAAIDPVVALRNE